MVSSHCAASKQSDDYRAMTVPISLTDTNVFTALRGFILGLITAEVIRLPANKVAMPIGDFIGLTPLFKDRLSTNINTTDFEANSFSEQPIKYTIQIDCYCFNNPPGTAGDWAAIISTMLRDTYGCANILDPDSGTSIQPLYCDDPKFIPAIDAENQMEERWMMTACLEYNPVVTIPQEFAIALEIDAINVDVTYPLS